MGGKEEDGESGQLRKLGGRGGAGASEIWKKGEDRRLEKCV